MIQRALQQRFLASILPRHLEALLLSAVLQFLLLQVYVQVLFQRRIPLLHLPVGLGSQLYPAQSHQ
jgi:hypothetical protein